MLKIQRNINAAKTLVQLCEILNAYKPSSEFERLEDIVDLCDLPTFGGVAPSDTRGVWSWDADNLIVDDLSGRGVSFCIECRDPADWYDVNN